MSKRLYLPFEQVFTNTGAIGAGWKVYTYATGTTTPLATYSDVDLTVPNTNPVVADAYGRFGNIYGESAALYKFVLTTNTDVVIETRDPVDPSTASIVIFDPIPAAFWGTTAGTSTAYTLDSLVDISSVGYQNTQVFELAFHTACGANPTINIDDLGPLNLKKYTGQGSKVSLQPNDIQPQRYWATNDGVDIIIFQTRGEPLYIGSAPTLTIASGIVTITNVSANYLITTEGGAASDDLETIDGGVEGQVIYLGIVDSTKDVVIKNGSGNIILSNQADLTLDLAGIDILVLKYDGTDWREVSRSMMNPALSTLGTEGSGHIAILDGSALKKDLIIKWGIQNSVTSSGATVTFPTPFPNAIYSVMLTPDGQSASIMAAATSLAVSGFTINNDSAGETRNWRWLAIGY